jgi:hypothetical protein
MYAYLIFLNNTIFVALETWVKFYEFYSEILVEEYYN